MEERDLVNLEYNKLLDLISGYTPNPHTQQVIKSLKPSRDKTFIEKEIAATEEFIGILREEGFFPLSEFPDIRESINLLTIQDSVLFPKDIYEIGITLRVVKDVKNFLQGKSLNHLRHLYKELYPLRELEKLIFDSVDNTYTVKDDASYDLRKIRREIREIESKISSTLEKLINSKDYEDVLQEKFITIKRDRFVVPVKYNFVSRVKGIIQDKSSTGQTVFVEPIEVVNLNNRLIDLKLQEGIEIRKVLKFITDTLSEKVDFLKKNFNSLLELDVLYTKGKFAIKTGSIFPKISDRICLKNAIHPIFVLKQKDFKPLDVDFGNKKGLIITGSNTGGKTVALKTIGLLALSFQSGIPIPVVEGSTLPIFDGIYIDIGDSQSIEENLSTFSAHVLNIKRITPKLTENSLVLFDELIPGTDPDFASSLGIAILEKVRLKGSFVVATTHLRKIKLYGVNQGYFRVAAVGFDRENLLPTYEIIYDTVGESMAFHIAEKLGLDEDIIRKAKDLTEDNVLDFEETVNSLNKVIIEYSEKLKILEEKERELQKEVEKYKALVSKLEEDRKQKWKESFKDIENFIDSLRKEGYEVLKQIREEKSGKPLENFIKTKRYQLSDVLPEEDVETVLKEGDAVKIKNKPQTGSILQIKDKKAKVDFGGVKIWVNLSELEKVESATKKVEVKISAERPKVSPEINLIGKTKEDAIKELESYVDKVILSGIKTFRIVHGFGSGILRKAVREFLDRQPFKVRYEDAPYHEGGLGVTIVHLE